MSNEQATLIHIRLTIVHTLIGLGTIASLVYYAGKTDQRFETLVDTQEKHELADEKIHDNTTSAISILNGQVTGLLKDMENQKEQYPMYQVFQAISNSHNNTKPHY